MKDIAPLVTRLKEVQQQTIDTSLPIFIMELNSILENNVKDVNRICNLLDSMLDLAFNDEVLILFKQLCRYLYSFNPEPTISYIEAYREMWEDE